MINLRHSSTVTHVRSNLIHASLYFRDSLTRLPKIAGGVVARLRMNNRRHLHSVDTLKPSSEMRYLVSMRFEQLSDIKEAYLHQRAAVTVQVAHGD